MSIAESTTTLDSEFSQAELTERVRSLVRGLLKADVRASDISYALAYVAAELGLAVADEPVRAFPVVLGAISRAAALSATATDAPEPDGSLEARMPGNGTVH